MTGALSCATPSLESVVIAEELVAVADRTILTEELSWGHMNREAILEAQTTDRPRQGVLRWLDDQGQGGLRRH